MRKVIIAFLVIALFIPGQPGKAEGKAVFKPHIVASDGMLTAAILPDGTLFTWGSNEYGEAGNFEHGDYNYATTDKTVDKPTAVLNEVKTVTVVSNSVYAIRNDNTLWAWGFNHNGKLGTGTNDNVSAPVKIMEDVEFVASGHALHQMAIKKDHTLWAWGWNEYYQLGDNTNKNRFSPVKVMDEVKYAAVGYDYSAVIKTDGSLWTWGRNGYGNLGNGNRTNQKKPVKIMENVTAVSIGQLGGCALKKDGTLWAWGYNIAGDVGDGTKTRRLKPVKIMSNVTEISSKLMGHFLALKKDGTLWSWGSNTNGQLGSGSTAEHLTPKQILSDVISFDNGINTSIAVKKDNTLWVWGHNDLGQLGTGNKKDQKKPVKIMDLDTFLEEGDYSKPDRYIDGCLYEWSREDLIFSDETGDSAAKSIDLQELYAYKDKKNIYFAVSFQGNLTDLVIALDFNGDGQKDGQINYDASDRKTYVFMEYKEKDFREYETNSLTEVLEFRVPLDALGKPKQLAINCDIYKDNSDSVIDETGWVKIS